MHHSRGCICTHGVDFFAVIRCACVILTVLHASPRGLQSSDSQPDAQVGRGAAASPSRVTAPLSRALVLQIRGQACRADTSSKAWHSYSITLHYTHYTAQGRATLQLPHYSYVFLIYFMLYIFNLFYRTN